MKKLTHFTIQSKKFILAIIPLALIVTGCASSKPISVQTHVQASIPDSVFSTCTKPTTITDDFGVATTEELNTLDNSQLDVKLLAAYGSTKNEQIACYRTVLNIKSILNEQRLVLIEESPK